MEEYTFGIRIEAVEEGGYIASVPVLPGCHTQGDTFEEAMENLRDALRGYLERMIRHGWRIPVEGKDGGALRLSVSAPTLP